jgi:oligoribonuclease NrnB/cAMP/cGMP phosphodiesterase (DHH superfamily)
MNQENTPVADPIQNPPHVAGDRVRWHPHHSTGIIPGTVLAVDGDDCWVRWDHDGKATTITAAWLIPHQEADRG